MFMLFPERRNTCQFDDRRVIVPFSSGRQESGLIETPALTHHDPVDWSLSERNDRMPASKEFFEFDQHQNVLIVTPNGPFMEFRDNDVRNAYNEAYRRLSLPETKHLLVDFSQLDYFGSTFVGILIRLAKKVRSGGGQALLCNLNENMRQMMKTLMLLENTKTDFFWSSCDSREAGLNTLASDDMPS